MVKFWICWVEGSTVREFCKHESFDVAQKESERLARQSQNDGKKVFVFECIGSSTVKSVIWESAKIDEAPF